MRKWNKETFYKKTFNSWAAIGEDFIKGKSSKWQCKCICGKIKNVRCSRLVSGESSSCGCTREKKGKYHARWEGFGDISKAYFSRLEAGAKRRNIEFEINIEYAWEIYRKQDGECALSGVPLFFKKDYRDNTQTASLDRKDSTKGYVKDNVQWVHKIINEMKTDLTETEFIKHCRLIANKSSQNSKPLIMITGSNGLVGNAIENLHKKYETKYDFIFLTRKDGDLTNERDVKLIFEKYGPNYIIHTAAKVGGIGGNINEPAEMFRDNILMNTHLIHHAWKHGVQKFLAFSSVCVFPDGIPILKEEFMQQGEPYHTQFAYGAAKRAVDTQIRAYKKQYGDRQYCSVIPCNIFGVNDYYDLQNAHVIPSLIHKLYLAKHTGVPFVVWGDGSAKREFIFAEDLARIIFKLIGLEKLPERVIVSREKQFTIKEVAEMLCKVANYKGEIVWDTTKTNGQHSRPSDLSVLKSLVGEPKYTDMEEALKLAFCWFEMKTLDKSMDYTLRGM